MLRFSCFSHNHNQRSKKVKKLGGIMDSNIQENAQGSASTKSKSDDNNHSNNSAEQLTSPSSHEDCSKLEILNIDLCPADSEGCHRRMRTEKTQSFGCIVDKERGNSSGDVTDDDEIEGGVPYNDAYGNVESSYYDQQEEHDLVQPLDKISDNVHHESLFSIEALQQFATEQHADLDEHYAEHVNDSGRISSDRGPALARSQSANNLTVGIAISTEDVSTYEVMGLRTRSFENLHFPQESDLDRDGLACNVEAENEHLCCRQFDSDGKHSDEYDSHNYNMDGNTEKELDTDLKIKNLQQESPSLNYDELNPKELSVKRIQEWISKIDIEGDCIVEEPGESSGSFSGKEPLVEVVVPTTQPDARSHLGMEVAYNYISSLTPTSSAAQMANLGLVAVPFLSAFVGLRVLNLSGNAIVRITAGSLPRGLHILNLSKNNIALIEGLRDLTRLRVLDLSYNRIIRFGHGLASCSSLKELYVAGNKISDIEGLHRLLKLNILDLRSNKISTAKGLGQLAANYGSLQAINLDGNPAQRNVGDEQLKKYLLSILPNLVYYNKQSIRASSMKEILDHPPRSTAHHIVRSTRIENKLPRRGSHSSALHKLSANPRSSHAAASSSRQLKSRNMEYRHTLLPPIASKLPFHHPEVDKKLVGSQASNAIRRIRSEGNLS